MKVGILHLSDIHIENASDWIVDKGEKIAQAVLGKWEKLETIFIVVSGDVANKGFVDQYSVAQQFFYRIRGYFESQTQAKLYFIFAPGNHDCDFSEEDGDLKGRRSFIDTVVRDPSYVERGDSIYKGCLSVQKNFFRFVNSLDSGVSYPAEPEVFYQIHIQHDEDNFYFNIFNTAWLSEINENQGGLVFPTHLIDFDPIKLSNSAFSASVYHHPENWLDHNNAILFRTLIEKHSDIILSGHEHFHESYLKQGVEDKTDTQIIKAGALQERSRPTSSTFTLVIVDLDAKKQQSFPFTWRGTEYISRKGTDWQDFIRNRFLQRQAFYLLPEFESYVTTLDSITWHTRKRVLNVQLDSFFVAPIALCTCIETNSRNA